jgi:hypothetical protein
MNEYNLLIILNHEEDGPGSRKYEYNNNSSNLVVKNLLLEYFIIFCGLKSIAYFGFNKIELMLL